MLSPLDDRYRATLLGLDNFFSEKALWSYRLKVELEYLKFILDITGNALTDEELAAVDELEMTDEMFKIGKDLEVGLRHDIKALEELIRNKLLPTLGTKCSFIHFGLTSEDVNNVAQELLLRDAIKDVIGPSLLGMMGELREFADEYKDVVMLGRTHGQPAVPTTLGRELFVHLYRMTDPLSKILEHNHCAKIGGAVGCLNAHRHVFPDINWKEALQRFLLKLQLQPELLTTQVRGGQKEARLYHNFVTLNNVLIDFCRDIWTYASFGYLTIRKLGVGSSTMPQKSNPIEFENAEGNLKLANALFTFFADEVTKSRLQRDLSGSTVKRNLGVAFGHSLLAYRNIKAGVSRLVLDLGNIGKMEKDLIDHPEVYAEALQQSRRATGDVYGYEEVAKNLSDCKPSWKELSSYKGYALEQGIEMNSLIWNFLQNYHYDLSMYRGAGNR